MEAKRSWASQRTNSDEYPEVRSTLHYYKIVMGGQLDENSVGFSARRSCVYL